MTDARALADPSILFRGAHPAAMRATARRVAR
jgi:hypothetical protein